MERFTCVGKLPQFYWSGLKKKESIFIIIIVLLWQLEDNHVESFSLLPLCEIGGWNSGPYMANVITPLSHFTNPPSLGVDPRA